MAAFRKCNCGFTDVREVRKHLQYLVDNGAVVRRMAEYVGVSFTYLHYLKTGYGKRNPKCISEPLAQKILGMHLGMSELFVHNSYLSFTNHGDHSTCSCRKEKSVQPS